MNISGKRSDLPLFISRKSGMLCAAKHSWTTLRMSRPLFVSSYLQVTRWNFRPMKRKKNLQTSCKRLPLLSLSPCRLCYLKFKRVSIIAIDLMYFRSVYALFVRNANKYKQIKTWKNWASLSLACSRRSYSGVWYEV